jgi:PKD domain
VGLTNVGCASWWYGSASFYYYPSDPSTFDAVQFNDQSYDPGGVGISSETWSFGDGTSSSNLGCCPSHRYAADGDYPVTPMVSTSDGRTASKSQLVQVRTHDVTITKVTVPQTASVAQTRTLVVGLTDNRYPETVQVQLLKSVAGGGWQQVGLATQYVPVRGAKPHDRLQVQLHVRSGGRGARETEHSGSRDHPGST